jgi:PhnB protein
MQFVPYLNFDGRCADAFDFYASTLGGQVTFKQTFGESPMNGGVSPDWSGKIMHATVAVAGQTIMGSDAPPERYHPPQGFYVSIHVSDPAEGQRIFDALARGGKVHMPYEKTFWSPGFGMLEDRFGIPWMVNSDQAA